jgi:hypothetical protein
MEIPAENLAKLFAKYPRLKEDVLHLQLEHELKVLTRKSKENGLSDWQSGRLFELQFWLEKVGEWR